MAEPAAFHEPGDSAAKRWAIRIVGGLLILGILWFIYSQLTQPVTIKAKDERTITAAPDLLPPPPPPPPPPPEPIEKPPEPTEAPTPTPEAAAPKPDAPAPMTVAADAQAGTDSFGLQAGSGQGSGAPGGTGTCVGTNCGPARGGGISDGLYRNSLRRAIQSAISGDSRVNKFVFTHNFEIVVSPGGRITRVRHRDGSGKANETTLAEILEGLSVPPPPVKSQYPVVIQVRGRNQLGG
ncbi:MAG: hypothetical protein ACKVOP_01075 [Sphingomonadaceae bacterium]